ncbi:hypothetical protein ABEB36_011140 [Hypothenemus hampei]|uniref:Uncharacterized protein n=1 Tax=Hypothenemus hampei TaxID=57062 RepID=A0ABD1EEZ6_HYPHA
MITSRILDPVIVTLLFALITEARPASQQKSRNLLYGQPGVVAVYIRPGNTPLEDINPELAEAFDFNAIKHGRRVYGRQINEIINEKEKNREIYNPAQLRDGESYTLKKKEIGNGESHIQKIPKN